MKQFWEALAAPALDEAQLAEIQTHLSENEFALFCCFDRGNSGTVFK
ncbi:MAG: hypothetical protein M5U34_00050 [Chloroflexi bacterium]|nr:hypothetical protein [Chloroflexota bacterium]